MVEFAESGTTFRFDDADVYLIEKSAAFNRINGAKPCECVAAVNGKVVFVEAKLSSPSPVSKENFGEFTEEITRKFQDSLTFFNSVQQKRQGQEALPDGLKGATLKDTDYEFVLIVKGHPRNWLQPLLDQIKKCMKRSLKLWGINDASVKVMNEVIARDRGIVATY